ncbi:MAG: CBS domain-containing protein [Syntrophobacteraceae bacterium]|jgi:CBS domain-containing protein|nr:CBS domain-containing protein [Syntrophobacteraceae bacterium]
MLKVKDIMSKNVVTVSPDMDIVQVAAILLEKRINGLPVVDSNGRLVGIICQSDLIAQQKQLPIPSIFNLLDGLIPLKSLNKIEKEVQKISATTVAHAMTVDPVSVDPEASIETVASLMVNENFHSLPVVERGKLVGIVGKEDVLRTLLPGAEKKPSQS